MCKNPQLTLTNPDTGEQAPVSGEFTDEKWGLLEKYVEYSIDLASTKLVQEGMRSSVTIKWEQGSGITTESQLPHWDDVIVFLHKFRPLGLQGEETTFNNICSLLWLSIPHSYFQSLIRQQRMLFSGKIMRSQFKFVSNDEILNSDKVLFAWLNAYEYHRDQEKKVFVDNLHKLFPLDGSKALFLHMLADKAAAIFNVAGLVQVVLGQQDLIELPGRSSRKPNRSQTP